jgi:hypothetical protein
MHRFISGQGMEIPRTIAPKGVLIFILSQHSEK